MSEQRGLDAGRTPQRWERVVDSIVKAAGPELSRRAAGGGGAWSLEVELWARPLLAAAATLILASLGGLALEAGDGAAPGAMPVSELESALYPAEVELWMRGDRQPLVEEVVYADAEPQP